MKEIVTSSDLISERDLYKRTQEIFGFDFVSGLPCGELRHFITESSENKNALHVQATNEREAVGMAQGAWLAGKKPALYMQNSGLFESSNDIASLLIPCKTPVLFIVSWRGAPGEMATQHFYTGASTIPLLESFGLPYVTDINSDNLKILKQRMESQRLSGVILIKRGSFNDADIDTSRVLNNSINRGIVADEGCKELNLSREGALDVIFELLTKNDAVVSSTGLISRSIFQNHDDNNQFYNSGAFGLSNMISLGFAINTPNTRTVTIEGDGSVLTNLGSLNVIGHYLPTNYLHIVLDNEVYASCSGEKTYGSDAIPSIARDCGYQKVFTVQTSEGLKKAINDMSTGPCMIHVQINKKGGRDFKRPLEMDKVSMRFREKFCKI